MTQLSLTVRSPEAIDLTVAGEFVVRCKCPKCLRPLRRSRSLYLYKGAPAEQSIEETCGHCGHSFDLAVVVCNEAIPAAGALDASESESEESV